MKTVAFAFAAALYASTALAGMAPMWQDYYVLNTQVTKLLEEKKPKLTKAQYDKYAASLKDGYKKMESGVGRMVREDYYKMGDVEFKKARQIRDELSSK